MADPGSGGFEIDGKVYALDTGLSDEEGGAQGTYSSGDVRVDKSIKDISTPTRRTLGEYVSNVTKAKVGSAKIPNEYSIDKNSIDISIEDELGYPTKIAPSSNSEQFAADLGSNLSIHAGEIKFKKGKSKEQIPDGNSLLQEVNSPTSPIPAYQSAVLRDNRWYSPTSPLNGIPDLKQSTKLGSTEDTATVSNNKLAAIGSALLLRATTELGATTTNFNPGSVGSELGSELPGPAQAAVSKVKTSLLTAADVLQDLSEEPDVVYKNYSDESWGSLNNQNDQFSGLTATGMIALSAALTAALQLSLEALFAVISSSPKKMATRDSLGRYTLGSYHYGRKPKDTRTALGAVSAITSGDIGTTLGIMPTTYPFLDALKKGSRAFFGVDDSGTIGQAILTGFNRAVENPGFNVVVARSIIRSAAAVLDKAANISGNPVSVAKQTVGMIEVLKSSKIIAACNVFAQLGDAILTTPDSQIDQHAFGRKVSKIDARPDSNSAVQKSRLKSSLKLAWSGDRTNTLLLLPKNITAINQAGANLGVFNKTLSAAGHNGLTSQKIAEEGRLTAEQVEAVERKLEAEYAPFYFHDIRTNEIISFHAFLSSLNDSFNANYETTNPYGRVDNVMVYKNTNRSLNFSFMVAATSQEDFDTMWIKINKLITLVYPQFTAGKLITDGGDYSFRQPFSQQIGASPLIRLRIGDVVRSNYSRFGLARLFGLGDPNMKLNGLTLTNSLQTREDLTTYDIQKFEIATSNPKGLTFIPGDSVYAVYDDGNSGTVTQAAQALGSFVAGVGGGAVGNSAPKSLEFLQLNSLFMVTGVKKLDDENIIGEVALNEELSAEELKDALASKAGANADDASDNFIGGRYIIPISALRMTKNTRDKMYKKLVPVISNNSFANELNTFVSADVEKGNAIAKSFKTTQGKGLPGFIQNMTFEWIDGILPWETSIDRVAPKIVKINCTFAAIHDIAPGIDHQGYNRSPIFPVSLSAPETEKKT